MKPVNLKWVYIELPTDYIRAKKNFEAAMGTRLETLKKMHLISTKNVSKTTLLTLQREVASKAAQERDPILYSAMSVVAQCIKISHALELLQSQGPRQTIEYINKMKTEDQTKAVKVILADENFRMAENIHNFIAEEKLKHPKLEEL